MWKLARTPRWIGALVLALAIACVFGALGQWQISRAIQNGHVESRPTETVQPLTSIAKPQTAATQSQDGQRVSVTAVDHGDYSVLSGRLNDGSSGYWVMAHFVTPEGASLAVAMGWTADAATARRAAATSVDPSAAPIELTGRYVASEAPQDDDFENGEHKAASVEALINEWSEPTTPVYGGYLVAAKALLPGLDAIDSPAPAEQETLNWLNVFYAVEWGVFAILAFYMWYRLLKDAFERQQEEAEEAEEARRAEREAVEREGRERESAGAADVD